MNAIERDESWLDRILQDRRLMTLIVLLAVVAGLSSFFILPRMEDPVLRRRVALVNTMLPGADAERVETLVSEKIEDRLRDIEEIKELRSVSRQGISTVSIELHDAVMDTDSVWSRVRSRIEDALPSLPSDATRPQFEELEVRAYALITGLVWHRDEPADVAVMRRLAINLQDILQNLPGTDLVDRFGDPGEEIEIELDPAAVAALGMSPGEVARQVSSFDAKASAGQVRQGDRQLMIEIGNQLDATSQIKTIPIRQSGDRFVQLGDVASIRRGIPDPPITAARLEGNDAVVLGVMVRPSYRIDHWTAAADVALEQFEQTLPAGIELEAVLRQTDYVDRRLASLAGNLLLGALAVSLVIWLMMGFRSAVIVTLALPLASMMVLFFLRIAGIPIHQMSITGLIISLGLLIDNAIVIVDEVKAKIDRGDRPVVAAGASVRHLAVPLIGSTVTTALAFAPIALMPGPAGEFVGAIALSVMAAIFSSFFLAMTVIPAIASSVLPTPEGDGDGRRSRLAWMKRGIRLPSLTRWYRSVLRWLMMHPAAALAVCLIAPMLGFAFAPTLKEQFFPPSSRDQFYVTVEGPAISSLAQTRETAERVERTLRQYPIRRVDWFYGESAPQFYYNVIANRRGSRNFAQGLVTAESGSDPSELIRELQTRLQVEVPSSRVLVRQLEQGPPFEAPIEVRLFGPDLDVLRELGNEVRRRLIELPGVSYSRSDLTEVLPMVSIDVDDEAARMAGVLPVDVADHFRLALEGASGGSVLEDNEQVPIVVRVGDIDRGDLNRISAMEMMTTVDGINQQVPLSAISTVSLRPESAAIVRLNRQRMNEVAAYLEVGVLPSEVQSAIEESLENDPIDLPSGYQLRYGGSASKRDDAVGNLFSTVGVLATMMLATLVLSLGSFRASMIIGAVAVLSIGLGLLTLKVGGYPFGFMSIIGTMGLIGVAINDSIVVLAAVKANGQAAAGNLEVLVDEVVLATRHIVATTLTTMAGFTPLILDGGTFWPPMAVCIAGGVAGATLLALVFVPTVYRLAITGRGAQSLPIPAADVPTSEPTMTPGSVSIPV